MGGGPPAADDLLREDDVQVTRQRGGPQARQAYC